MRIPSPRGQVGGVDAPAHVRQVRFRSLEPKLPNFGRSTARRLRNVSQSLRHGVDPPGKVEKSERASGDGCRCNPDKAPAIEIGRFWHTGGLPYRRQCAWSLATHYWTMVSVVISRA